MNYGGIVEVSGSSVSPG